MGLELRQGEEEAVSARPFHLYSEVQPEVQDDSNSRNGPEYKDLGAQVNDLVIIDKKNYYIQTMYRIFYTETAIIGCLWYARLEASKPLERFEP